MTSPYTYNYPSPVPSPLFLLPSITQQTSGLGLTPNSNPFLAFQPTPIPPSGSGSVRSINSRREEISLEDTLRGLEEGGRLVDRARGLLVDIGRLEGYIFGKGEGEWQREGQGDGQGEGEVEKLDLLQLEYDQIIKTLYTLSISTLFGSLPLSLTPNTRSDPIPTEDTMTTTELTSLLETRAALEFSRRESVKGSGKIVLDILKNGR